MEKIKIAVIINDFLVGGAQRLTADMLCRLSRDRFEPILITLNEFPDRDTMYDLLPKDIVLYRLSFRGFFDIPSLLVLVGTLWKEKPDVVLSSLYLSNTISRIIKLLLGYTVIVTEHNTYIDKSYFERVIDRVLAHLTYAIVAVSNSVKTFTAAQEGIPESKFRVILNGIDRETIRRRLASLGTFSLHTELNLPTETKFIINTGRLTGQKNHVLLLEGFARCACEYPVYDLLILGDGGWKVRLVKYTRELGIADRVHFLGNKKDTYPYYAKSEFFISTSKIEGFGIAHVEALSCGLPLLSTKTAGPDEIIEEGKNGFFIRDFTAEAVAEGLRRMMDSDLTSLRAYAKESSDRYDIAKTAAAYEALILQSLRRS